MFGGLHLLTDKQCGAGLDGGVSDAARALARGEGVVGWWFIFFKVFDLIVAGFFRNAR